MKSFSRYNTPTFYCFIPLVSLATFLIEMSFALYVWYRYKATTFSRLCIAVFLCLGVFQLSEFLICTYYTPYWIKLGYVAITILPALGIHIISVVTKRHSVLMTASYGIAALLIFIILFVPSLELRAVCQTHFVEVFNSSWFAVMHVGYYAFFVTAAMYTLWYSLQKHIGDTKEEKWMLIAYIAFVLPSLVLIYFKFISHLALPSVMCGFAVFLAIILALVVIPRYYDLAEKKKVKKKKIK